ncbi:MAG: RsmE family RNA methyltransferase [Candidatus Liptonbacteria bacterium]|nr:RsmE family RNA methyltransferase [Candidatus Liptonbacteria bacterium]
MTHRFIGKFPLEAKQFWIADRELAHQVKDVLRLQTGEQIILSDGLGQEAEAEIVSLDKEAVEVRILAVNQSSKEPKTKVILYLAILKKENFDLAVQKAVEVGVSKIVPLISGRTVKLGLKRDRLQKIIKEASEQSGRSVLPELEEEINFKEALVHAKVNDFNIFFNLGAKSLSLLKKDLPSKILRGKTSEGEGKSIGIFIGPEGGWKDAEVESAKAAKFVLAGLGNLTLRAETAAIVAVYEVISNLG